MNPGMLGLKVYTVKDVDSWYGQSFRILKDQPYNTFLYTVIKRLYYLLNNEHGIITGDF